MASKSGHVFDEDEVKILKAFVDYQNMTRDDIEAFCERQGFDEYEVDGILSYIENEL
mgnify:CR=1 FL=1|tara:strand:+ start:11864 stop:12034 length:171 start_codon:yes stop_codon:yes gene_type:complete